MHRIPILLTTAFDSQTTAGELILGTLGRAQGRIASAENFARTVGYRDRHHLTRALRNAGLPPLESLVHWTLVLTWAHAWELHRTSLSRLAAHADRDVAGCYRIVRRVTGLTWTEVRTRGSGWVVVEIQRQYGRGERLRRAGWGRRRPAAQSAHRPDGRGGARRVCRLSLWPAVRSRHRLTQVRGIKPLIIHPVASVPVTDPPTTFFDSGLGVLPPIPVRSKASDLS